MNSDHKKKIFKLNSKTIESLKQMPIKISILKKLMNKTISKGFLNGNLGKIL